MASDRLPIRFIGWVPKFVLVAMTLILASCAGSTSNLPPVASRSVTTSSSMGASPSTTTSASASPRSGSTSRAAALDGAIKQTGATYLEGSIDSCPAQHKCLTIQSQVDGSNAAWFAQGPSRA